MRSWKSRKLFLVITLLVACVSFSCRRNPPAVAATAPPPPPPTPPPPPVAAPTITLTATPATITPGQQSSLVWEATNATSVVIEPEIGTVVAKGTQMISPPSSVTYTARATGPGGNAQAIQRITVNAAAPAAATAVPNRPQPTATLADLFNKEVASQPILFDYDSSEIRADQVSKLQSHAQWLKRNGTVRVSIQGHADERGSQEYNVALGDERAASVMKYLVSQGVSGSQMTTVSFGEEKPVCRTADDQCLQQNRRANFEMAN